MKFYQGKKIYDFKLLDDNGEQIDMPIAGVDIRLRPGGDVSAVIHVEFPGCDIEVEQDKTTLRHGKTRLVVRDPE